MPAYLRSSCLPGRQSLTDAKHDLKFRAFLQLAQLFASLASPLHPGKPKDSIPMRPAKPSACANEPTECHDEWFPGWRPLQARLASRSSDARGGDAMHARARRLPAGVRRPEPCLAAGSLHSTRTAGRDRADVSSGGHLRHKRVFVVDGEPVGAVYRYPARGDFRIGAPSAIAEVSSNDRAICTRLAPALRAHGLRLAGLDVIGHRLIEVNITSPGAMRKADVRLGTSLCPQTLEMLL